MNDLYLIGNGFDLAHGLKTSYNDFLLWYLKESISKAELSIYEDDLLKIDSQNSSFVPYASPTIPQLLEHAKRSGVSMKFKHDFFKKIVNNYHDYKWVDIEYEYYMALVEIFRDIGKNDLLRSDFHFSRVKPLNECFEFIKNKLVEYLKTIQISQDKKNRQIEKRLLEYTGVDGVSSGKKLFLYFNYTNTIDLYRNWSFDDKIQLIHIHGKLGDNLNPIIFGYGDEMDSFFSQIKQLNQNDFLVNMKSYDYLKTSNLQRLNEFLNEGKFTAKIMGHSCGVSDRVLLNRIFEHQNCDRIKVFYYETEKSDDYSDKIREISRHLGQKNILDLVCPKGISEPMVCYAKQAITVK